MGSVSVIRFAAVLLAAASSAAARADDEADSASRGARLFAERCALCHAAEGAVGGQGPSLAGVVGRKAAATAFASSAALRRAGWVWDAGHLDCYLAKFGRARVDLLRGRALPGG